MDWNKLEAEVKKDEKDEKLEGEQALQKLFRDIYGNADEDTRRAMNKSFQVCGLPPVLQVIKARELCHWHGSQGPASNSVPVLV